jgi:hypothetical protein
MSSDRVQSSGIRPFFFADLELGFLLSFSGSMLGVVLGALGGKGEDVGEK